jgi:cysteine-rich repeat protein
VGRVLSVLALAWSTSGIAAAQTVAAPYDADYTVVSLGAVPGLPTPNGGLAFLAGDPNTLIIGGRANQATGALHTIGVVRDGDNNITGFSGAATLFADAPYIDGGIAYAPNGVLFASRYPRNEIGQIKPGSATTNKVVALSALSVDPSLGGLTFVPAGFPGAGQLKIVSYNSQKWYTLTFVPDANGTYDITGGVLETTIAGGPEGFVYVPQGSPQFTDFSSMLVSEYSANQIAVYQIDANGDPLLATRTSFITGLTGAEGAAIDPLTGDFLFSTFQGGNRVIAVRGFGIPCGNGAIDPGEQCDDGNIVDGDCCSSTCQFEASTVECRPATGACDIAEFCDGASGTCPADGKSTAVCRAAAGVCDVAESCNGVADTCPADGRTGAGTPCRAAADVCDAAETCDGVSVACPADGFLTGSTTCRAAVGPCDAVELCSGASAACPVDGYIAAGSICRAAAGACDLDEQCTGTAAACPADAKDTAVCRAAAGTCDVAESCDGLGDTCPADGRAAAGTPCRAAAGVCDAAEACDGVDAVCPAEAFLAGGTACRAAAGPCDVVESCTGAAAACPANTFVAAGSVCRAAAGVCDLAEQCTGTAATCPADAKSTAVCRPASGACDVADACDGVGDACPADGRAADGTVCDDGDVCTVTEECASGVCIGTAETVCAPCETCDPDAGCLARPWDFCRQPMTKNAAVLVVKNASDDARDQLSWKWSKGEETATDDFGDPTAETTYAVCVYDAGGDAGAARAVIAAEAPAGGRCGGKPCWKRVKTKGFKYKDRELSPDGVDTVVLKSGADGRAGIIVKAKSEALGFPDALALVPPVRVQLQADTGECWEATYSRPAQGNAPVFKARSD